MNIIDIDQEPPKIEFPCDYPIKVMGFASVTFQSEVLDIVHRHASPVSQDCVTQRASSKGNYVSVTVIIVATGENQLKNLFGELMQQESIKMVL